MEEWVTFAKENPEVLKYVAASSGSGEKDFMKLKEIVAAVPKVGNIFVCWFGFYKPIRPNFVCGISSKF